MTVLPLAPGLLLATTGLACLCLSQPRHAQRSTPGLSPMLLRCSAGIGWLLLALLFLVPEPTGPGIVQACGSLSLAALLVTALATWQPRRLPALCLAGFTANLLLAAARLAPY